MTIEIFGCENKEAFEYAIDLGIGMQLTNILQDEKEDSEKYRIYIPQKDLKNFNYQKMT
jgi:phytoene synthase